MSYIPPEDRADVVREVFSVFPEHTIENATNFLNTRITPDGDRSGFFTQEEKLELMTELFDANPEAGFKYFHSYGPGGYGETLFGKFPSEEATAFLEQQMEKHPEAALKFLSGDDGGKYLAAIPYQQRDEFIEKLMEKIDPEALKETMLQELQGQTEESLQGRSPEIQALFSARNHPETFNDLYNDILNGDHYDDLKRDFMEILADTRIEPVVNKEPSHDASDTPSNDTQLKTVTLM